MSADLLARLIEAGTPAALVAEVAMLAAEVARVDQRVSEAVSAAREPSAGALRTRRWRERHAPSQNVTCDAGDVQVTENVTAPPSLDKETSPSPPKEINPIPGVSPATRETPVFAEHPLNRIIAAWLAVIATAEAPRRKRWKNMPPPPGVTDEQWRGYLDHRKAKRHTLTDRAYTLTCGKLAKLSDDEWPPGRLVDLMVERGWLSIEATWIPRANEHRNDHRPHYDQQDRRGSLFAACADDIAGSAGH